MRDELRNATLQARLEAHKDFATLQKMRERLTRPSVRDLLAH